MATAPMLKKELTDEEAEIFGYWNEQREALAKLKVEESEARTKMLAIFYPKGVSHVGTQNWQLPGNFVLTVVGNIDLKVDEAKFGEVRALLNTKDKDGNCPGIDPESGEVIALDNIFKTSYEVIGKSYKALTNEQRACFAPAITLRNAAPSIKLEQKAAKAPTAAIGKKNPFDD